MIFLRKEYFQTKVLFPHYSEPLSFYIPCCMNEKKILNILILFSHLTCLEMQKITFKSIFLCVIFI